MAWARDLTRVIRASECDAGLRSAEVLRDCRRSCHGQLDLSGDFLLHPICGASLLYHIECSFWCWVPDPGVVLCWCDLLAWTSDRWRWRSSVCYFAPRRCVSE